MRCCSIGREKSRVRNELRRQTAGRPVVIGVKFGVILVGKILTQKVVDERK